MSVVAHTAIWGIRGTVSHEAVIGYEGRKVSHTALIGYSSRVAHTAIWDIQGRAAVDHEAVWAMQTRGIVGHQAVWDMPAKDRSVVPHTARWSLLSAVTTVISEAAFLEFRGDRLDFVEASVGQDEGGAFWRLSARLTRAADWTRLEQFDPITLDIFGDRYELAVESLTRSRGAGAFQRFQLTARSRLWPELGDLGPKVTRTWGAVGARATVEELAGEAVDWRVVDWIIPAGKLASVNETAMSLIQRIAATAGAVVESRKDGVLLVRYRYPVSIPQVPQATVDHELTEAGTVLDISEQRSPRTRFNKIFLATESREQGFLSAERDPNQSDQIFGGEQQKFLVYHSEDVEISGVILSAGSLIPMSATEVEVEEELIFANTNEAELSKPVSSAFSHVWYGTGLGALTLGADGRKVRSAQSGVGVALASYKTTAKRYAVLAPATLGGSEHFPIVVYVIGALREDAIVDGPNRIIVQRGLADIQGEDIIQPLAGNDNVLFQCGRNAIDGASPKGEVSVMNAYPADASGPGHILNGQLVLLDDTQIGVTWRGKVTNIEHRIERAQEGMTAQSSLAIERFLT